MVEVAPAEVSRDTAPRALSYDGVQCLRFVAAMMVVLVHSTFYVSERLAPGFPVWTRGAAGVDIFFVISGFVMYLTYPRVNALPNPAVAFMTRRIARIVPAYWLVTTLKVAIMLALPGAALHATLGDPGYILKSYFFIPAYNAEGRIEPLLGVGWTLIFEMAFYAVFALALALKAEPLKFCSAVLVPCAILSIWRQPDWPAVAVYCSHLVLEFLAGMMIARYATRLRAPWALSAGLAAAALAVLFFAPQSEGLVSRVAGSVLPAAAVVCGVVMLERHLSGLKLSWLVFLGAASYSLYLIHPIVAPAMPQVMNRIGLVLPWLSISGSVICSIIASIILYIFFEKKVSGLLHRVL